MCLYFGTFILRGFRTALRNTHKILKKGSFFRCVVSDLEFSAREYLKSLDEGNSLASLQFMGKSTLLGIKEKTKGLKGFLSSFWGNAHHLWMWDKSSLQEELKSAGFGQPRVCTFNDSEDPMFKFVENIERFENAVAIECKK